MHTNVLNKNLGNTISFSIRMPLPTLNVATGCTPAPPDILYWGKKLCQKKSFNYHAYYCFNNKNTLQRTVHFTFTIGFSNCDRDLTFTGYCYAYSLTYQDWNRYFLWQTGRRLHTSLNRISGGLFFTVRCTGVKYACAAKAG